MLFENALSDNPGAETRDVRELYQDGRGERGQVSEAYKKPLVMPTYRKPEQGLKTDPGPEDNLKLRAGAGRGEADPVGRP